MARPAAAAGRPPAHPAGASRPTRRPGLGTAAARAEEDDDEEEDERQGRQEGRQEKEEKVNRGRSLTVLFGILFVRATTVFCQHSRYLLHLSGERYCITFWRAIVVITPIFPG